MLTTLIVFSVLVVASEVAKSPPSANCKPYPKELKSLEECCKVPVLFDDDITGTCEFFCSEDKKDSKNPDCPVNCLFKNNGILSNKKINRTAMEWTYDKFGLADPRWRNITHDGLDECDLEYDPTKSFKDAFDKFESCINEYYRERCIEFKEAADCEKVEEFMDKCQNIHADCTTWPKWIVKIPEYCCPNRPELFEKDLQAKAKDYCSDQDIISNLGTMQCLAHFMLNFTGVHVAGKWNYPAAKKLLLDHSGNDAKWTSTIDKTMETCEKQVNDDEKAKQTEAYVEFWFYECVKGSTADFCPEYSSTKKECKRLTKYKQQCPNSVPPRKVYMVNGKM